MNKTEFIRALDSYLGNMDEEEKKDIIYDYEEHFLVGIESGKNEEDIANSLGNPKTIARQFKAGYAIKRAEQDSSVGNVFKAVLSALGLGLFNLIFLFGPFMAVIGVIIGLFGIGFGISIFGLGCIIIVIIYNISPSIVSLGWLDPSVVFFAGIGLASFGALFLMGVSYIAKYFFRGTVAYLKMNVRIIKK